MKKLILIAAIGLVTLSSALSQDNNTNSTPSTGLVFVTNTITTVRIAPLKLTAAQLDGIIQMIQASGISANVPITSTNLADLSVAKIRDGFVVNIRLK